MSRPSNRRGPGRVAVQVARQGGVDAGAGPGQDSGPDEVSSRGRHRSPDAGAGAPVLAASALVGAPRHRRARPDTAENAGPAGLPARSLARVEAAQEAAARPAAMARPVPTTGGPDATAPVRSAREVRRPTAEPVEEAVTDLVVRPGRGALPDGPGTGPGPAVLGCVVSVVALVAAVVAAVVPAHGGSSTTLLGVLAVALLGTGSAALGLGRQRTRRSLAATGVVIGASAVTASVISLLTL